VWENVANNCVTVPTLSKVCVDKLNRNLSKKSRDIFSFPATPRRETQPEAVMVVKWQMVCADVASTHAVIWSFKRHGFILCGTQSTKHTPTWYKTYAIAGVVSIPT
jgi:hypothetical protein